MQESNPISYISQIIYLCIDWDDYIELLYNIKLLRKAYKYTNVSSRTFRTCTQICANL